jgi:hypothetical protein
MGRVVGVDIARFVALAGMMAIHILPAFEDDELTVAQGLAGGRSSALFAVLAGVSLTLMTGRRAVPGSQWEPAASGIAVRAVLIALIGLFLGGLPTSIAVILTYYGLLFLLGIPFLVLGTRTLLLLAVAWGVASPVVSQWLRPHLEARPGPSPSFDSLSEPAALFQELMFTGYYPAFPWLTYLLVGMAVGRLSLTSYRTMAALGVTGAMLVSASYLVSDALLARDGVREELARSTGGSPDLLDQELAGGLHGTTPTASWWWLAVRAPHSGTPFDLGQTIGSALLVLALCLVVGRALPRLGRVVFGAGAMTLTLYSLHVVSRQPGWWDGETTDTWVGQVLTAMAIGALYALMRTSGPLERVVSLVSRAARGSSERVDRVAT